MNNTVKRIFTSVALISLIFISVINSLFLLFFLLVIALLSIFEFNYIYKKIFNENFLKFISNLLSIIYLSIFSTIIWVYISSSILEQIISLIFILLICVFTDIGGFIFGKLIGGKKLTKISPNKTFSGMIGSFIFALIFGYLFYYSQKNILLFEINVFILIMIVSFISQIGDLFISFLKRKANIKDTGSVLPGHGGILDRIDGILLALPIGIILISL